MGSEEVRRTSDLFPIIICSLYCSRFASASCRLKPCGFHADNQSDVMNTARTSLPRVHLLVAMMLSLLATSLVADETKAESVLFKGSRVAARAGGKEFQPTNTVVLASEVRVGTNGSFTVATGKKRQLSEGQGIDATGMLASPDGTLVPVIDHLVMLKGMLNLVKDGESQKLSREYKLADGSVIGPDGTVRGADGRLRRLLDGQIFKLDGSAIGTADTVTRIKGEIVLQKDGGRVTLRPAQTIMMSDGTKVSGNGTVTKPDGTRVTIKEGEILRIEGVKGAQP